MSGYSGIACVVSNPRRPKQAPVQPPAEFGRLAVDLARSVKKSPKDLVRAAGRESMKTLDRLIKGEGSLHFAHDIRRVLKEWGADVSVLPSLDEESNPALEEWEREWLDLGRSLRRVANDRRFQFELNRIRDVIRAHEVVAEGTDEFSRR